MPTAEEYAQSLNLQRHPEGGRFAESYLSTKTINRNEMQEEAEKRNLWTSIYYLLTKGEVSHFHKLKSEEIWYLHDGGPLDIHMIHPDGTYEVGKLGRDVANGEQPQILIPAGVIFGAALHKDTEFALAGCMVAPGFDYADFTLMERADLLAIFPMHEQIIKKLTRPFVI